MSIPFSHPHHNMIRIPGGTFLMGSRKDDPEANKYEKPQHQVTVSGFEMGQYLVTLQLWKQVMDYNPTYSEGKYPPGWRFLDVVDAIRHKSSYSECKYRPVENVSWFDAVAFCNRLSNDTGLPCVYFSDKVCSVPFALQGVIPQKCKVFMQKNNPGYRLPTEAEWEYAAGGGSFWGENLKFSGGDDLRGLGWYNENSGGESHEVGLLAPNALGLCDMSGNLHEWCCDVYAAYENRTAKNPIGPDTHGFRLVRGGTWNKNGRYCRAADRNPADPTFHGYNVGFRLARSLAV